MVRTKGVEVLSLAVSVSLLALTGCQEMSQGEAFAGKVMLWNGVDLSGWEAVLIDRTVAVDEVWSVRDGVLHCTGRPYGYLRTSDRYDDYHLHVEWRWPEEPTNSGVLLHARGPDKVWPACIECQLKAGNAGDFVLMGGTGLTVDGVERRNPAKRFVLIGKKQPASELPAGRWNSYDIHCQGGSIRCFVNDILQNEGTGASVSSGWICLQSEGSPIEFRNIYLTPVE